jgi:hypothetical protein
MCLCVPFSWALIVIYVCHFFVLQVIDGIIGSVESAFVTKLDYASKFELCVNNVLDFFIELKSSVPKVTFRKQYIWYKSILSLC